MILASLRKQAMVVFGSLAIMALAAAILLAMGRTPWYKYGPPSFWSGDTQSDQNSQQLADPYTFTHVLHGAGFYLFLRLAAKRLRVGVRGVIAIALEAVWEVFENTGFVINRYRAVTISLGYYGDSVLNSIGDILTNALGFWLAAKLPTWVSAVGVVLLEVMLAFWIRDSLVLNILMLIYPIEAVKTWQLGG